MMPRVPRQFSRTGFYHIMMRGLNRERIFQKDQDKKKMLDTLIDKISDVDMGIYAYCIMDNHIHLLLKSEPEHLATFMKKVNVSFAMYYNRIQNRVGPVFQGRYKSECVENEGYFWGVLRYIHLNPVKAHIVKSIEKYEWSSINDYLLGESELLDDEAIVLKQENFKDNNSFLKMHEIEDLRIYLDVKEDLDDMKMTAGNRLIDEFLAKYKVNNVLELRHKEEAFQSLLEQLTEKAKLTYQEIAELTDLSYSMVQRLGSKT